MHIHAGMKHKRERLEKEAHGEPSLPKDADPAYIQFLDKVTLVAGIVGPFTVLPQIYEIFSTQQAAGVSVISWILLFIVTLPWVFYGFAHKDRAIIWSFILWEVANAAVIVGAVLYGS